MTTVQRLTKQLEELQAECACLRKENELLKRKLALCGGEEAVSGQTSASPSKTVKYSSGSVSIHSSTGDKIALFRNLFRGREDVYPVLWTAKDGRQGYSPACKNEWDKRYCNKKNLWWKRTGKNDVIKTHYRLNYEEYIVTIHFSATSIPHLRGH